MKSQRTPKSGCSQGSSHEIWLCTITASQTHLKKLRLSLLECRSSEIANHCAL